MTWSLNKAPSTLFSAVLFRLARVILICGLCASIGTHWVALQPVAWATMLVGYAKHTSMSEALAKTFDGKHPCGLCKTVAAAQHSPKKHEAQMTSAKLDLICTARVIALAQPSSQLTFVRLQTRVIRLVYSPAAPPPRLAFS